MTESEIELIRRAVQLLLSVLPDAQGRAGGPAPRCRQVGYFATRYLIPDPISDMTSAELWRFYSEIVAAGELEPLTKQAFQRALPGALEAAFGVKKCHNIERAGRRLRGFRGIDIRLDASPPDVLEVQVEAK